MINNYFTCVGIIFHSSLKLIVGIVLSIVIYQYIYNISQLNNDFLAADTLKHFSTYIYSIIHFLSQQSEDLIYQSHAHCQVIAHKITAIPFPAIVMAPIVVLANDKGKSIKATTKNKSDGYIHHHAHYIPISCLIYDSQILIYLHLVLRTQRLRVSSVFYCFLM